MKKFIIALSLLALSGCASYTQSSYQNNKDTFYSSLITEQEQCGDYSEVKKSQAVAHYQCFDKVLRSGVAPTASDKYDIYSMGQNLIASAKMYKSGQISLAELNNRRLQEMATVQGHMDNNYAVDVQSHEQRRESLNAMSQFFLAQGARQSAPPTIVQTHCTPFQGSINCTSY